MATAHRVFWETVIFLTFLVVLAGVLFLGLSMAIRPRDQWHADDLSRQHEESLRIDSEKHQAEIASLERKWTARLADRSRNEAEAVLNAFEAGAHTAIAARWGRYLATATETLTGRPEVLFLHIVTPQGRVVTGSDETLRTSGRLDETGEWVLAATGIESRTGAESGMLELAMPVREGGRTVAFLWMGYDATRIGQGAASGQ